MARVSCGNVVVTVFTSGISWDEISQDQGIKDGSVIICLQRLEHVQMDKIEGTHFMDDATNHPVHPWPWSNRCHDETQIMTPKNLDGLSPNFIVYPPVNEPWCGKHLFCCRLVLGKPGLFHILLYVQPGSTNGKSSVKLGWKVSTWAVRRSTTSALASAVHDWGW